MTEPFPIVESEQPLWRRLQWGVQMGLVYAVGLTAFVGVQYLLNGAGVRAKYGIGFLTMAATYLASCIAAGLLVGLLLSLTRTKVGSAFVGVVAFVPVVIVMHYPGNSYPAWTGLDVAAGIVGALLLGVPLGVYYYERVSAPKRRTRRTTG